jgi:predicted amidohydrolase YtcJ
MMRPAKLGITINWSCHWSGGYFGEEAKAFLGEEKWLRMYQFNPIIDSGALVSLSSDVVTFYELNRADPFFGMQVAHTRVDPQVPINPEKYPGSVRPPDSAKLSREFLLEGYTINSARQMRWDHIMGSITQGKLANMLVLSDDLFLVDAFRIKDIEREVIIFDGNVLRGDLEKYREK